ncbi:hypothetical protein [Vibrio parahaemolyticus]|uniref:hypothetical protein n=1 Tax=Vibrio parahaemolyticus TaxID=670 RepID=UPI003D9C7FDB
MDIKKFFKLKSNPESVTEEFNRLQEKSDSLLSNSTQISNFEQILNIIHNAHSIDSTQYILDIFFEFQASKHKVKPNQDRLYREMSRLNEFKENSKEEAIFLVNVYRSLISDLFDPYISLIYASIQYVEGKFDNYIVSNLGQGERNKVEFCTSKLNNSRLFDGYDPVVRNAISHLGTDGVSYENNKVIFKSIKRGNPPRVESVVWTNVQIQENIIYLIRLTQLIDYTVDVFNLDISDKIKLDKKIQHKYLDEVLTHNDRKALQHPLDNKIETIISNKNVSLKEKITALTYLFFIQCRNRNLDVKNTGFQEESQTIIIEVNGLNVDTSSQQDMTNSIMLAIRCGIAAEPCFKSLVKRYVVLGEGKKENQFRLEAPATIFNDYNNEVAGLFNLATEIRASVGDVILNVNIDFDKLEAFEMASLGRKFPRRS